MDELFSELEELDKEQLIEIIIGLTQSIGERKTAPVLEALIDVAWSKSKSMDDEDDEGEDDVLDELTELYSSILENVQALSFEPYIDDQPEIEDIYECCEQALELIKEHGISDDLRQRYLHIFNKYDDVMDACAYDDAIPDLEKILRNRAK